MINAIMVVESNKYSKNNRFKDIEMFKEELNIYDKTFNEYEYTKSENAKADRAELLKDFI